MPVRSITDTITIPIPPIQPGSHRYISRPPRSIESRLPQLESRVAPPLVADRTVSVRQRVPHSQRICATPAESLLPYMFAVALLQLIVSCATAIYALNLR
ncbi:g938 [Coccomyxa elongata]